MCLAKVCMKDKQEEILIDSITSLKQTPTEVIVTSLFGDEKTITGRVFTIDFTESIITITQE
ncbi:MAG: CooT family nickel-binding protein [Clostridiales bacterium]